MDERVDAKFREIDNATQAMQRDLERTYIRPMQASALRKGAKCCDDMSKSAEQVQQCIENTQRPLQDLQTNVKQELERFQSRIQRCAMTCQDSARDSMGGSAASESLMKEKFNNCLFDCAEQHVKLVPQIKSRLEEYMKKAAQ